MPKIIDIEPYENLGYRHLIKLNGGGIESATYTPVDEIKTVDAVPVLRCKDCENFDYEDGKYPGFGWCDKYDCEKCVNGFCDIGERKDELE